MTNVERKIIATVGEAYLAAAMDTKDAPETRELKPNCFGFSALHNNPKCVCLKKIDCAGCPFYKNRHVYTPSWNKEYVMRKRAEEKAK